MSDFDFEDKSENKVDRGNLSDKRLSSQEEQLIEEGKKRFVFKFEKIYLVYIVIAIVFMMGAYIILSKLFFNDNKRNEQKPAIRQHQTLNADFVELKPKTPVNVSADTKKSNDSQSKQNNHGNIARKVFSQPFCCKSIHN